MGHEINAWMMHTNRWQATPEGPIVGVWFCPQYKQFDILRPTLVEKCFGSIPRWKVAEHKFVWPDGSELYVASHDRDWSYLQGIALDLCVFDEHFKESLWLEMMLRRRGTKRTKFVIAATMTKGLTWEHKTIYTPWLKHHQAQGLSEFEAMRAQSHRDIFCWPYGGIADNPSMTAEDVRWYTDAVPYSCEKEKMVRLGGGFQDWSGDAVFDFDGLLWIKRQAEAIEAETPTEVAAGSFILRAA